jgi:hypothetical protein
MMNDETEPFERRLSRQPPREIPTHWRAEILSAAQAAGPQPSTLDPRPSLLSILIAQLSAVLRPHPQAWAGLAAAWVVILTLQLTSRDPTEVVARNPPPPSPEMLMVLRQQKLLLAELVERPEPRAAEQPKALPLRPRSDRSHKTFTA